MLEIEVDCSQFQRIYVQGCPATRPGPADSSACPDCTPARVGCVCRQHLLAVDHSHPYTFAKKGGGPTRNCSMQLVCTVVSTQESEELQLVAGEKGWGGTCFGGCLGQRWNWLSERWSSTSGVSTSLRADPVISCCGSLKVMPQVATQCSADRNRPGHRQTSTPHPLLYRSTGREHRGHLPRRLPFSVGALQDLLHCWPKCMARGDRRIQQGRLVCIWNPGQGQPKLSVCHNKACQASTQGLPLVA
ncbi:UNVERIFIED_CONTAM: hypothetical protein FKN15_021705 [Acipenser sinensis]